MKKKLCKIWGEILNYVIKSTICNSSSPFSPGELNSPQVPNSCFFIYPCVCLSSPILSHRCF